MNIVIKSPGKLLGVHFLPLHLSASSFSVYAKLTSWRNSRVHSLSCIVLWRRHSVVDAALEEPSASVKRVAFTRAACCAKAARVHALGGCPHPSPHSYCIDDISHAEAPMWYFKRLCCEGSLVLQAPVKTTAYVSGPGGKLVKVKVKQYGGSASAAPASNGRVSWE